MPDSLQLILLYISFPVVATILGGVIATFYPPGPRLSSAIQHFATGVVFAAVASELLPEISAEHNTPAIIIGFSLGAALMLGVKWILVRTVGHAGHREELLVEAHEREDTPLVIALFFAGFLALFVLH